jgi:hypothetical protein
MQNTAGERIVKKCVQFLKFLPSSQKGVKALQFQFKYPLWHSDPYRFVLRMPNYTFIYKKNRIYNM